MNGWNEVCFVDMPFGKKNDLTSGVEVDFDQIYAAAIEPAILDAGLQPIRGDRERTGGIIHAAMYGRLLLSGFVVADLTLANPNVFYELGIRHTAQPYTTVPIFASIHSVPFDVSLVRAIPYSLENGKLSPEAGEKLKSDLRFRLRAAIENTAAKDSPIFQLIPGFPAISLPEGVRQTFEDKVQSSETFRQQISAARAQPSNRERLAALMEIQKSLGDLRVAQREILVNLMLSLRDVSAWKETIELIDRFADHLRSSIPVRQQRAFALNRRNEPGDRVEALRTLKLLIEEKGADPETYGLLGRIHKDEYRALQEKKSIMASAALDEAITAYTAGFESDPRDYFPGVNAVTLLIEKGDEEEAKRLLPLVTFAVERKGGASSTDYWVLATTLELGVVGNEWAKVRRVLPKTLQAGTESWKIETTAGNLLLLKLARERTGQTTVELTEVLQYFQDRFVALKGAEKQAAAG